MADEQTDITKGEPLKDSSASSAKSIPSPDAVAEAFAVFEKAHTRAPEILPKAQSLPSIPVPQNNIVATPLISTPSQIEVLPPKEQLVVPPQFTPPPEHTKTEPGVAQEAPPPQISLPPTPEKKLASTPPTTSEGLARTPTPIVPASFPIKPIAPAEKPVVVVPTPTVAVPVKEEQKTSDASSQQKPATSTEATEKKEAPAKVKPTQPTTVETLRAQATSPLHPLRTLRSDVESTVKDRKTSMVTVAAAEEDRRASGITTMPLNEAGPAKKPRTVFLIVSAIILLLLGGGLLAFVFIPRQAPVITGEPQLPASTLISVDEIIPYALKDQDKVTVMNDLVKLRDATTLSLGLIREVYPTISASTTQGALRAPVQSVLKHIAPHVSEEFLRTLNEKYVLGIHVFDGNQAFLVLTTSAYEQTFSGMVAWEPDMSRDLLPLFERRPRPRTPNERLSTSTTPSIINTGFTDAVIENHDTRVLKDADGNIVLLWSFINQTTLVVTTNDRTLTELVTRIRNAPTLGL